MKTCGIPELDKKNRALIKEAELAILTKENSTVIIQKIYDFRMKLAYKKATESLESNFGWTEVYDKLIENLSKNIKTES
jgi:hypothetical protein